MQNFEGQQWLMQGLLFTIVNPCGVCKICCGIWPTLVLLADLSYKELSGRPKNLWGVYNKMQLKRQKLDSIYDLRAIRVIVRDKTDCYAVLRQVCVNHKQ